MEATAGTGAPETSNAMSEETAKSNMAFSSHGRTWMIVLKPTPRGKHIDQFICRWTGESFIAFEFAKAAGHPYFRNNLLLTTIGSKSGSLRTSCLPFFPYGDELVVVGSKGGGPTNPFWSTNIRVNPRCWIRIKRKQVPATARIAEGEERDAVFAEVSKVHRGLERYQERASSLGRDVPLVMIKPSAPVPVKRS